MTGQPRVSVFGLVLTSVLSARQAAIFGLLSLLTPSVFYLDLVTHITVGVISLPIIKLTFLVNFVQLENLFYYILLPPCSGGIEVVN